MTMGQKIKVLRESQGWSQETLARKMGYKNKSTIAKIEAGVNDLPQVKVLKFASVFCVSPSELLSDDSDILKMWENNAPKISEEVRALDKLKAVFGREALHFFSSYLELNNEGQKLAFTYIQALISVPTYRKEDEQ